MGRNSKSVRRVHRRADARRRKEALRDAIREANLAKDAAMKKRHRDRRLDPEKEARVERENEKAIVRTDRAVEAAIDLGRRDVVCSFTRTRALGCMDAPLP